MSLASLGSFLDYRVPNKNTGAGNSFLGGLSAGLLLSQGDVFEGKES